MHLVRCLILGCSLFSFATAWAVEMAVTASGDRFEAQLVGVEDKQIVFESDDGERRLAIDDLVRWSHPVAARPLPQVLLSDGSVLMAAEDWSGQGSIQLGPESLTLLSASFQSVSFARQHIAALLLVPPSDLSEAERMRRALREREARTDELWLLGGDRREATVKSCTQGQWTIVTDGGETTVPAAGVQAAALNPQLLVRPPTSASIFAVGLRDGSRIHASALHTEGGRLTLTTAAGERLADAPLEDIVSLQTLHSARFVYLSEMEPADYRHFPYLELDWPWQPDGNLVGGRLVSGGNVYLKGIAMHSASRLTYALAGGYRQFVSEIALDDTAGERGSVVFRVFVARDGQWHEEFTSEVVRGGDRPRPIEVDVAGAQAITLIVDYADWGDELDHANWLDARLVK